jgi:uncharacterized protein YkwD
VVVAGRAVAAQTGSWLDTSSRAAVINAYNTEFGRPAASPDWSGTASSCAPGATSAAHRSSVLQRVNFFRSLAGVPAKITENAAFSAAAQQAALMVARSGRVSHNPDPSYVCRTPAAVDAAGLSNLFLGFSGVDAINGYVRDEGIDDVGHRAVLLHPPTRQMGTGDVPSTASTHAANTLYAFDEHAFEPATAVRESEGFIAWPPRGHVPADLVYPTWSLTMNDTDFTSATVAVSSNGTPIPLTVSHRGSGVGAPSPSISWVPTVSNREPNDRTYDVVVNGATVNGTQRVFRYSVTVLGRDATTTFGREFDPYVDRAHQDFLDRPATSAELDRWSLQLASGLSRYSFVRDLSSSAAWTNTVIDKLYLDTLGRSADAEGRTYWARKLQTGTPVASVAAAFYGSPEYVQRKGATFEPWVADLYVVLLGRDADDAGLAYWAGLATSDGSGVVAYRLYQSQESRSGRVIELYQRFLGRGPDAAGLAYWVEQLASGDDLALAASLAASAEYGERGR